VSLAFAWLIGAAAVVVSSYTLSLFHTTPGEISLDVDRQPDLTETERTRQKDAFEAYTLALHAARSRVLPLTIAELLVGAGMVVFSQRAAVGRAWARHALVQLTVAHVALSGLAWELTPDMRAPETAVGLAASKLDPTEVDVRTWKLASLTWLGLGVAVGAITVLGLTLRGSRAFYETTPNLVEP
jgi:hypothetical protein